MGLREITSDLQRHLQSAPHAGSIACEPLLGVDRQVASSCLVVPESFVATGCPRILSMCIRLFGAWPHLLDSQAFYEASLYPHGRGLIPEYGPLSVAISTGLTQAPFV